MPNNCPPGSSWVNAPKSKAGGWCVASDGTIVQPGGAPLGPAAPTGIPTSVGGRPGGVPGAPSGGGTGYTSLPGSVGGGGGGMVGGSSGGGGRSLPWWLQVGLTGGGLLLQGIGKRKERNATNAETARIEQERIGNAKGKAALMRGILNANGYGNLMTDEQILQYVMRTPERTNTAGGTTGDIGNILINAGTAASQYRSSPSSGSGADPSSAQFWDEWTRRFNDDV